MNDFFFNKIITTKSNADLMNICHLAILMGEKGAGLDLHATAAKLKAGDPYAMITTGKAKAFTKKGLINYSNMVKKDPTQYTTLAAIKLIEPDLTIEMVQNLRGKNICPAADEYLKKVTTSGKSREEVEKLVKKELTVFFPGVVAGDIYKAAHFTNVKGVDKAKGSLSVPKKCLDMTYDQLAELLVENGILSKSENGKELWANTSDARVRAATTMFSAVRNRIDEKTVASNEAEKPSTKALLFENARHNKKPLIDDAGLECLESRLTDPNCAPAAKDLKTNIICPK